MTTDLIVAPKTALAHLARLKAGLASASDPETLATIEDALGKLEGMMREAGIPFETKHEANAARVLAWAKLGRALKPLMVGAGRPKAKLSPRGTIFPNGLAKQRVTEFVRIGAMPDSEREKIVAKAGEELQIIYARILVKLARPYWYKESREAKHKEISAEAATKRVPERVGPFPLIYADPPWRFKIFSPKGLERTPDQKYPTLTYDQIKDFRVGTQTVLEIAAKKAALFLWCTSSNVHLALSVMEAWGFEFKSSAVWVKWNGKLQTGTGLVFRNGHELLLYGTRGAMPGPQWQPPSVFMFPRGEHSAKPPEIRRAIEKMYPDFDAKTRCELFTREKNLKGWTGFGFES